MKTFDWSPCSHLTSEEAIQGFIKETLNTKGVPQEVINELLHTAEEARAKIAQKAS